MSVVGGSTTFTHHLTVPCIYCVLTLAVATNAVKQYTSPCPPVCTAVIRHIPSVYPPALLPYISPATQAAKPSPELHCCYSYLMVKAYIGTITGIFSFVFAALPYFSACNHSTYAYPVFIVCTINISPFQYWKDLS